jgi:alkanesulfonate monooxygenase SsuD/methylene tetrahydromethanopterin reductase-like flavin-dependent oxidoreductase (luciferase family)
MSPRIGIQLAASTPPLELGLIAAEVERLGYGELWLAEDYFELGGIASVGTALGSTLRMPIGLGVVSVHARHPAVTAMEFATLAGAFPGRFQAGVGHGVPSWLDQMGRRPTSLIRSLRDGSSAIRRLLDGAELTEQGEFSTFDGVRLLHPPDERLPLYFGVHGPRSLRLSGEIADGTLLGWFSSPDYVSWARERIYEGRVAAGRTDDHAVVALCIVSISDDDPAGARAELAAWATEYLAGQVAQPEMLATDAGRELEAALQTLDADTGLLPDSIIGEFMAAGSTADCDGHIERLLEAGADRVVLVPNPASRRSTVAMVDQIRQAVGLLQN